MNKVEVICDACEAHMQLSESLMNRIAEKTGRITCKQCGSKIALDARSETLRVTQGGSLSAPDLEVEEIEEAPGSGEEAPNSGLDLIDPGFSEFPAEIKVKEEDLQQQRDLADSLSAGGGPEATTAVSAPEVEQQSTESESDSAIDERLPSIPPPLSEGLKEKRRQSMVSAQQVPEESPRRQFEAPVPELILPNQEPPPADLMTDSERMEQEQDLEELGHAPPSTRFSSERDQTFRSLYPEKGSPSSSKRGKAEPALAPAFSSVPTPPARRKGDSAQSGLTPGAVILGSDGTLHNRSEYVSKEPAGSTWLPWTIAAISLLALGVSLSAQFSGDFRDSAMKSAGALGPESEPPIQVTKAVPSSVVTSPTDAAPTGEIGSSLAPAPTPEKREVVRPEISPAQKESASGAQASTAGNKVQERSLSQKPKLKKVPEAKSSVSGKGSDGGPAEQAAPSLPPFNQSAASSALSQAATLAKSCRRSGDPAGKAKVVVTFAASGRVTNSLVSGPPFAGTPPGGCIAQRFRAASVPAFSGDPVTITRIVTIP